MSLKPFVTNMPVRTPRRSMTAFVTSVVPCAITDISEMDILLDSKISMIGLLFLLPKIFTGKHIESKYVEYLQAKSLSIKPLKDEILNIDGENKLMTPVNISIISKKINIFY